MPFIYIQNGFSKIDTVGNYYFYYIILIVAEQNCNFPVQDYASSMNYTHKLEFFAVIIFAKAAEYAASIISMQRKLGFATQKNSRGC